MRWKICAGLVASLAWLQAFPVLACSLPPDVQPPTLAQRFAAASAVFVGHIVRTAETDQRVPFGAVVAVTIRPVEILKGKAPADLRVEGVVYGVGNCSVPMITGLDYVFLLEPGSPLVIRGQGGPVSADDPESLTYLAELRALARRPQ